MRLPGFGRLRDDGRRAARAAARPVRDGRHSPSVGNAAPHGTYERAGQTRGPAPRRDN